MASQLNGGRGGTPQKSSRKNWRVYINHLHKRLITTNGIHWQSTAMERICSIVKLTCRSGYRVSQYMR